jgi:chromosome segregation ATPase
MTEPAIVHKKGFASRLHVLTSKMEEYQNEQDQCQIKISEFQHEIEGLKNRIRIYTETTLPKYTSRHEELNTIILGYKQEIEIVAPYAEEEIRHQIKKDKIAQLKAELALLED